MADTFSVKPHRINQILFLLLAGLVSAVGTSDCAAQTYGLAHYRSYNSHYYPYTIARPQDRTWIRNLPMEKRPNRPLHFYGNMVRQNYSVQRPSYDSRARLPIRPTTGNQFRR